MNKASLLSMFGVFALLLSFVSAASGTSSITLSTYNINIATSGTTNVNYTINLANGTTSSTMFVVGNQNLLASQGIEIGLSNQNGNPPFNGVLTVNVLATATPKTYHAILFATGNNPSRQNVTLTINVTRSPLTTVGNATTSVNNTNAGYQNYNNNQSSGSGFLPYILVLLLIIVTGYLYMKMKSSMAKMMVSGAGAILVGIVIWLIGDYGAGSAYVWLGVLLIIAGTLVWLYADMKTGALKDMVVILSVIFIIAGTAIWLYGDFVGGSSYVWPGVALLVIGTLLWLYGENKGGIFKMKK